ncbi:hypothetical protein E5676_scaffold157G00610 [Cucumis melo var. makuwa]|uniref:Uncharacterized protein n=1 Tax=Cucumis melo var. makuwa TaxID=1194695 RepID=A0A5D3C391_CUCMM|nr:hypothetical protein E6C27_scaffold455G00630 [Cucumis melo var. makuwa]TYK06277.1 hypothetical protein E5676_scaffold157G00610 [Cucumis melo var. makuwa]
MLRGGVGVYFTGVLCMLPLNFDKLVVSIKVHAKLNINRKGVTSVDFTSSLRSKVGDMGGDVTTCVSGIKIRLEVLPRNNLRRNLALKSKLRLKRNNTINLLKDQANAESWLVVIEKCFNVMRCPKERKVFHAESWLVVIEKSFLDPRCLQDPLVGRIRGDKELG